MIGCFNCPITANSPITLFDYNCTKCLVKKKAAPTPITFEEIVMVMITSRHESFSVTFENSLPQS